MFRRFYFKTMSGLMTIGITTVIKRSAEYSTNNFLIGL